MNTPAFTQVEAPSWPSGSAVSIAVTTVRPELFARAFDLAFSEDEDNLEPVAATVRLRSGRMAGLVRHAGDAGTGTEVYVDANDDFVSALREFLDAFDLSVEELKWIRNDIPRKQLAAPEEPAHR